MDRTIKLDNEQVYELNSELHAGCEALIGLDEHPDLQLVGRIAHAVITDIQEGEANAWRIPKLQAMRNQNPILAAVLKKQIVKKKRRSRSEDKPSRDVVFFFFALKSAALGHKVQWGEVILNAGEPVPEAARNYKSRLKKQYLEPFIAPMGYYLLCDARSALYCKKGVELLAQGDCPLDVETFLSTGKRYYDDLKCTPKLVELEFSSNPSTSISLQDLAKQVLQE